ncbi:FtsX-like permease family protein (plasmid) [Nostoc sp. C052]|uniref:ABC transporter permease DevC n=1 Tax=Nostoc sp. C052 TaxID=2576902 RepID=UPI0015C3D81A|nr:ABC transporter permease DevC [Nostoc sp. C052]QLE45889.1 FtsX-like permease family protein [Nostoc sp. C052]
MFPPISLAWLQLNHKKSRLIISIIGVAFSVALMFTTTGLKDALFEDSVTIHKTLQADLVILSADFQSFWTIHTNPFPRRIIYSLSAINGIVSVNPFYVAFAGFKNPDLKTKKNIGVVAFNPDKPTFNLTEVNQQISVIRNDETFLFDRLSRPEYGEIVDKFKALKKPGSVVTELLDNQIKIGGFFSIGGGVFSADGLLITSDLNYANIFNRPIEKVHLGLITITPGVSPEEMIDKINQKLSYQVKVITKAEFIKLEKLYWQKATPIGIIFNILSLVGFIFGAVIVYQIIFTQISDYISIYATFKAIGYTNFYIIALVLQESFLISIIGYIPGLLVSLGLYKYIQYNTRLPMILTIEKILTVISLTIFMCIFAALMSIFKLKDADPAELFQ